MPARSPPSSATSHASSTTRSPSGVHGVDDGPLMTGPRSRWGCWGGGRFGVGRVGTRLGCRSATSAPLWPAGVDPSWRPGVACPNGGGLNQPRFRSFADRQERFLVRVRRLRFPLGRVLARWIMSINDRRLCRASRWLGMSVSLMVGTGFGRVGGLVVLGGGGWVGVSRR
jgi:hypothetical protein